MHIGAHVSAAKGIWNAPKNAADLGLETFQVFSRPPQGGNAPVLSPEAVKKFKAAMKEHGFADFVIHAPYFTNLGSANPRIYHGSISVLREELERGTLLGASFMMFHPGSFRELGEAEGMKQVVQGIGKVLEQYQGTTQLLVEISAGAGQVAGDTFEELAQMLEGNKKYLGKTLGGVCFDTQHAFASGYDLRDEQVVKKTFAGFDKVIGLEYLRVLHINDSKVELGGRKDRHEHIKDGHIGKKGFAALAAYMQTKKKKLAWILEVEHEEIDSDIKTLAAIKAKLA